MKKTYFSTQALGQIVLKFFQKNWHGSYSSPYNIKINNFIHLAGSYTKTRHERHIKG